MLNTKIKNFKTIAYYKNKFFEFNSSELKKSWNLLFFFPFSYSYICPTELKELSININNFKKLNCNVYGISTDSHFTLKNWNDKELNLNFPLLSDFNKNISKNNNFLNKIDGSCNRGSLILDPNQIIKTIEIVDNNISRNINILLERLEMLNYTFKNKNELCPINWIKNKNSIKI